MSDSLDVAPTRVLAAGDVRARETHDLAGARASEASGATQPIREIHDSAATIAEEVAQVAQHFRTHRQRVYAYLRYMGCAPPEAEEITQETFLRLHRDLVRGRHIDDVVRWLLVVARRQVIDERRHRRPGIVALSGALAETLRDGAPSCEEGLRERQRDAVLAQAVRQLTPLQRECLHLRASGLSLREIAAIVSGTEFSVSKALRRAVQRLRQHLDGMV